MIPTDELKHIAGLLREHQVQLELFVHPAGVDSKLGTELAGIAAALAEFGGEMVAVRRPAGDDPPDRPALSVQFESGGRIQYLARPEGREAEPFLELLSCRFPQAPRLDPDLQNQLAGLAEPVDIWVFIAPACPFCPQAVRAANQLAADVPTINTTIIDAAAFPGLAERFKVRGVPMTVIGGELLITEVRPAGDLARLITARGSSDYQLEVLESLVKTGNLDTAVRNILQDPVAVEAFRGAWQVSTLSTRMGLLLAAEQALSRDPSVLDSVVPELVEMLDTSDIAVKGDTADLLGRIGLQSAKRPLEKLLQDTNPDIVEIAEEALKNLSLRTGR